MSALVFAVANPSLTAFVVGYLVSSGEARLVALFAPFSNPFVAVAQSLICVWVIDVGMSAFTACISS